MNIDMQTGLTKDLAEFVGILVGDGGIYKNKKGGSVIEVYSGEDDFDYMENWVRPLVKRLFDKDVKVKWRVRRNEIRIEICSTFLAEYLHENFGLPYGNKGNIKVPDIIENSNIEIKRAFIRGVFDTDFCFRTVKKNYPILQADLKSSNLVIILRKLLSENGIISHVKTGIKRHYKKSAWVTNRIQISGEKNLEKWMSLIGSNNPKHLSKIYRCMGARGMSATEYNSISFEPRTPSLEG